MERICAPHSPRSSSYISLQLHTVETVNPKLNKQHVQCCVLTEVSALDGAVVEGDTEVVTCFPQLRNGNAVRATDYPRLVVILPFSAAHTHTNEKRAEWRAITHTHKHGRKNKTPLLMLLHSHGRQRDEERERDEEEEEGWRASGDESKIQWTSRERGRERERDQEEKGGWRAKGDESKS